MADFGRFIAGFAGAVDVRRSENRLSSGVYTTDAIDNNLDDMHHGLDIFAGVLLATGCAGTSQSAISSSRTTNVTGSNQRRAASSEQQPNGGAGGNRDEFLAGIKKQHYETLSRFSCAGNVVVHACDVAGPRGSDQKVEAIREQLIKLLTQLNVDVACVAEATAHEKAIINWFFALDTGEFPKTRQDDMRRAYDDFLECDRRTFRAFLSAQELTISMESAKGIDPLKSEDLDCVGRFGPSIRTAVIKKHTQPAATAPIGPNRP